MSAPDPLTPPSPPAPAFEPYQAPAYGDVAPDRPVTAQHPAQPWPAQPWPAAPYPVAPQFLTNPQAPPHPLAVTSLVLGIVGLGGVALSPILGFTFITALCSPFAIWLGARAKRQIRADPRTYGGEGMATGGFVTGIVGTVLAILGLLAILAVIAFVVLVFSSV